MIPERLLPGTLEWQMFHHEHEQRYRYFAERYAGLDVLDAACGVGYGTNIIARCGAKSVTGIDIDPEAVTYAGANFAHPAARFEAGNAEQLSGLGRMFDVVVSFETIEHLRDPALFLKEVRGVLRPRGLFICSTPNRDFAGKAASHVNPYHLSEMSFAEFAEVFRRYFSLDECYHQSHSEAYLRHLQVVAELGRWAKTLRFSKLLRVENWVRQRIGNDSWNPEPLAADLGRAVPGDYIIEPLEKPLAAHLTFILTGRPQSQD